MQILHVASSYPLTTGDGTAPFMEEMLAALSDRSHQVTVLVPNVDGLETGVRSGVRVIGARYAPKRFQTWGYGRSLGTDNRIRISALVVTPIALCSIAKSLRSLIRDHRPDIVHLHWVFPQGVLAMAVPGDIPIVVSAHGAEVQFTSGRFAGIARRVLQRADGVVAASPQILDLIDPGHVVADQRRHVIPHGANTALLGNLDRAKSRDLLGIASSHSVVLGIGRLVAKKGFLALVEAMRHLGSETTHLYVVGDGPQAGELARRAGGDDRIHFVGHRGREEVAQWYSAADVVVIPGIASDDDIDSGPVVLVEALAAGRAVVTTRIGMAPRIIRHNTNGMLIDDPTPRALATAIENALVDKERLGRSARTTFDELGGWDRAADDLEQVYRTIIQGRH